MTEAAEDMWDAIAATTPGPTAAMRVSWRAIVKHEFTTYIEFFDTEAEATKAVEDITEGWDRATWDDAIEVGVSKHFEDPLADLIPPNKPPYNKEDQ